MIVTVLSTAFSNILGKGLQKVKEFIDLSVKMKLT
jgi:hypothetical protein